MSLHSEFNVRHAGFAEVRPVPFTEGGGYSWEIFDEGAYAGGGRCHGRSAEADACEAAAKAMAEYWDSPVDESDGRWPRRLADGGGA